MDKIYGLLGRKLGHSYSVPIHKELGCEDYALYELEPEELAAFLKEKNIGGLNVTIPYKIDAMKLCDIVSDEAAAVGSANTIVKTSEGKLYAHNTDLYGFMYMAKSMGFSFENKKVVILGSGGAYLAVLEAAKRMGAREIVCISRKGEDNYDNLEKHADANVLVNATPVGMYPNTGVSPVSLDAFPMLECVLDLIYNPSKTALILEAKARNIPYVSGLKMLVAQAKAAEELFFGKKIDDGEIERITNILRVNSENIVLIGMPGSGKSSIGEALSMLTGREAIDTDEMIVEAAGISIPEIFEKFGEEHFRQLETQCVKLAGSMSGKIIMTGGGVIKKTENLNPLSQNGRIYHISRDISELARDGRPLSQNADLYKMYEERKPMYELFRDCVIENNATQAEAAEKIWSDFCENTCD